MRSWIGPLARRLHFHAGLFIGPFILIAALTGATYAVMLTVEKALYTTELSAPRTWRRGRCSRCPSRSASPTR